MEINIPLYIAYVWFAAVASFTPGPNCSLALAVGIHHGLKPVWRHALGICLGMTILMLLGLWGSLDLLKAYPLAAKILQFLGIAYLVYLGYCFIRAAHSRIDESPSIMVPKPGIYQSAFMQLSNPKAWLLITGTLGAYQGMAKSFWLNASLILLTLFACIIGAVYLWAWMGQSIRAWLNHGRRMQMFNIGLGLSLMLTALWLMLQ
jgi:threonine/homoserine/homoserine lactone efflux protein